MNPNKTIASGTLIVVSLLQFHQQVLAQATRPRHPLLERLFFLIIFSSNLDEFFEIRVAGLMQKVQMGDVVSSIDGMRPSKVLSYISEIAHHAVDKAIPYFER
ncbi:MAG: hypothetical protein U1E92_03500 [Moraxella osloensis]